MSCSFRVDQKTMSIQSEKHDLLILITGIDSKTPSLVVRSPALGVEIDVKTENTDLIEKAIQCFQRLPAIYVKSRQSVLQKAEDQLDAKVLGDDEEIVVTEGSRANRVLSS